MKLKIYEKRIAYPYLFLGLLFLLIVVYEVTITTAYTQLIGLSILGAFAIWCLVLFYKEFKKRDEPFPRIIEVEKYEEVN